MKCREKIFIFSIVALLFVSCRSTNVLHNGEPATEVRDNLSELQSEQSDSAITSERITADSANIEAGLRDIKEELRDRETDDSDFEQILKIIRDQQLAD